MGVREASQRLPRARGSDCVQLLAQTEPYGPGSGHFVCVSTHFEALSGCIRGQEFAIVRPKKSFNNLKDSGKHAFSVIGGGLKPQWLNMGGGLGEGGEIRKTWEGI